jgi:hypothetical protein
MTRARHDRLLAALIAKLPPEARWPRDGRIAWLQMMAMAFDVVYGPCDGVRVTSADASGDGRGDEDSAVAPPHGRAEFGAAPPPASGLPQRFYVDRDGFAMGGGRPIAMEDLPAAATLWDERLGVECGDVSAILWRGIGVSRDRLPPGITLRPVFDET